LTYGALQIVVLLLLLLLEWFKNTIGLA